MSPVLDARLSKTGGRANSASAKLPTIRVAAVRPPSIDTAGGEQSLGQCRSPIGLTAGSHGREVAAMEGVRPSLLQAERLEVSPEAVLEISLRRRRSETVAEQQSRHMRQSTIALTMDTYGHLFPAAESNAIFRLGKRHFAA